MEQFTRDKYSHALVSTDKQSYMNAINANKQKDRISELVRSLANLTQRVINIENEIKEIKKWQCR